MSACIVCSNDSFQSLPMHDSGVLARVARDLVQGMTSLSKDSLKNFVPPRRGTCIVERCARFIETSCGGCRKADCPRCAMAADLRAVEDQINADRDAELIELGLASGDLEGMIDQMVENLCGDHAAFGPELLKQWYARRSFLVEDPASVDAPQDT